MDQPLKMPSAAIVPPIESESFVHEVTEDFIASHPLGVKPLGNQYFHSGPISRDCLSKWAVLPDELLVTLLEHLDAASLRSLGSTCRFLYAFCHVEELWKALFLL